tara:strand:+ start:2831 stop:3595 length:765 start_codon:yes stop_codon:yes gene_type:complete
MCQHRFGVLNRIYQELMCEGYTNVMGMGITAPEHLADFDPVEYPPPGKAICMFNYCDGVFPAHKLNPGQIRILPWTHDFIATCEIDENTGFVSNHEYNRCTGVTGGENANHCGTCGDGETPCICDITDIWTEWDVTIRDLYIIDGDHNVRLRLNLTGNNPEQDSGCGDTYSILRNSIIGAHKNGELNGEGSQTMAPGDEAFTEFQSWVRTNYPDWNNWCYAKDISGWDEVRCGQDRFGKDVDYYYGEYKDGDCP